MATEWRLTPNRCAQGG